jgi:CheY-like chemotaxis protein
MSSGKKRILLVEDDHAKETQILSLISNYPIDACTEVARSVVEAVALLKSGTYDLIVLDIALPSHSKSRGAPPSQIPSGGLEIIYELSAECRSDPVIVLTQYPAIEYNGCSFKLAAAASILRSEAGVNLLSVNYFDRGEQRWRAIMQEALAQIA